MTFLRHPLVVHCKESPYDVYIGRGSKWGNPFSHRKGTRAKHVCKSRGEAIRRYEDYLRGSPLMHDLHELKGKVLGCWCAPQMCHGEVLVRLVEELGMKDGSEKEEEKEKQMSNQQNNQREITGVDALRGLFNGFDGASAVDDSKWPKIEEQGSHLGRILRVLVKKSAQRSTSYFILEYELLETSTTNYKVGETYSWSQDIQDQFYGFSACKNFLAASMGLDPKSDAADGLTSAHIVEACSKPENEPGTMLKGRLVRFDTRPHSGQSGHTKWVHSFQPPTVANAKQHADGVYSEKALQMLAANEEAA